MRMDIKTELSRDEIPVPVVLFSELPRITRFKSAIELKVVQKRWFHRWGEKIFGADRPIAVPLGRVKWQADIGLDSRAKLAISTDRAEVFTQTVNHGRFAVGPDAPSPETEGQDMEQMIEEGGVAQPSRGQVMSALLLQYLGGEVVEEDGKPVAYLYAKFPESATRSYSIRVDQDHLLVIFKHMGLIKEEFKVQGDTNAGMGTDNKT